MVICVDITFSSTNKCRSEHADFSFVSGQVKPAKSGHKLGLFLLKSMCINGTVSFLLVRLWKDIYSLHERGFLKLHKS
ncbi:hypothetical protein SOV_32330 [Sporomusa ovata DSM 2662]|nr:hypothetical protein SOV_5c03380 [Sporomusa ovata DSM 2662]